MRFDWYAATIMDEPATVLDVLASNLGGSVEQGVPRNGYEFGHLVKRKDGDTMATVYSGGRNGHPHVFASGDETDALVPVVRGFWADRHRVTRMDAAEDFDGPGTWDRLYGEALTLADELRIKINQAGDWHRLEDGRTFYLGSTSSAVRARLYEKGKQLRALDLVEPDEPVSLDLCRLEVQVRPEGQARYQAAACEPTEAFGYAEWSRELLRRVAGLDVDRVHIRERRQSDRERALDWLVRQYGEHLEARAEELGGWASLGVDLQRRREHMQR